MLVGWSILFWETNIGVTVLYIGSIVFVFLLFWCVAHAVHDGLKYTQSHEWVKTGDGVATVGITDHAQVSELATLVYTFDPVVCQLSSSS